MNTISFITPKLENIKCQDGLLCLFLFEQKAPLHGITGLVDWRLQGQLSKLLISDFISGKQNESILFPLGRRLPISQLILIGLGAKEKFSQDRFITALSKMTQIADRLKNNKLVVSLPGSPENRVPPKNAIQWFLNHYELTEKRYSCTIIDTYETQQEMLPEIERWRMRTSVTPVQLTVN